MTGTDRKGLGVGSISVARARSVPGMNLETPGHQKNPDLTLRINVPAALPRALRSRRPLPARLEPLPRTGRSDGPCDRTRTSDQDRRSGGIRRSILDLCEPSRW